MNKVLKWVVIVSACLIVFGAGIVTIGVITGGSLTYAYDFKEKQFITPNSEEFVEDTIDIDAFDELVSNTSSQNIILKTGDANQVHYKVLESNVPSITEEDGKLKISCMSKITFMDFSFNMNMDHTEFIEITVTEDTLKKVAIDCASGDVDIDGIPLEGNIHTASGDISIFDSKDGKDLYVKTESGEFTIENCSFDILTRKQVSGESSISDLETGQLTLESTSGAMNLKKVKCDSLDAHLVSGDIFIFESELGDIVYKATSGEFTVNNSTTGDIDVESTSGDIYLGINGKETDYNYDIKSVSGDIEIGNLDVDGKYNQDNGADKNFKVKLTSGSVEADFNE